MFDFEIKLFRFQVHILNYNMLENTPEFYARVAKYFA